MVLSIVLISLPSAEVMVVSSVASDHKDLGVGWEEGKDIQHGGSVGGAKATPTSSPHISQKEKKTTPLPLLLC